MITCQASSSDAGTELNRGTEARERCLCLESESRLERHLESRVHIVYGQMDSRDGVVCFVGYLKSYRN